MRRCKAIGCDNEIIEYPGVVAAKSTDYCSTCTTQFITGNPYAVKNTPDNTFQITPESSGGDNDYWVAHITHPKRLDPYSAECEDLIEHFQMTFQEGEAFKALWRKGQSRIGNGKPGDTPLRNAQKVRHFGARMEVMEQRALE